MPDFDGIPFKVDGVPFQANNLAAAQSVECSQKDGNLHLGTFDRIKQRVHLLFAVKAAGKLILSGAVYFISGIHGYQVSFHSVFQSAMDNRMIIA